MGQFLPHNPTQANQESDAAYNADSLRTGGVTPSAILPHPWLNKVWYQSSIFCAAFAQMMAAKGITLDDGDQNVLAGALAAILTSANGLNITNSTITTTTADLTSLKINGAAAVQALLVGDGTKFAPTVLAHSATANGYTYLPGGFILQWGYEASTNATFNFPIPFPTACFGVYPTAASPGGTFVDSPFANYTSLSQFFMATKASNTGNQTGYPCYWWAIGI